MIRRGLTKEQIKAIADRAEGKEPEYALRTFVCKKCNHEIVVNPSYPKYETPTICTPCWEKVDEERRLERDRETMAKFDPKQAKELLREVNKLFDILVPDEKKKTRKKK